MEALVVVGKLEEMVVATQEEAVTVVGLQVGGQMVTGEGAMAAD